MRDVTLLELLRAGGHFGHQTHRWNPKMKQHIFGERNGIYIFDLEKTKSGLMSATAFVKDIARHGGNVLFVGTKRQAKDAVRKAAERAGMPYITERWLGGIFTNFKTVSKSINLLLELERQEIAGEFEKYNKREQLEKRREIDRIAKTLGGLRMMTKLPEAIFVVDIKAERIAVDEARKAKVPVIALVDTNVDPDLVDYVIPSNDDAAKMVELASELIADAVLEGRADAAGSVVPAMAAAPSEPAPTESMADLIAVAPEAIPVE